MDILDMFDKIVFFPDLMLPEAVLPNHLFTLVAVVSCPISLELIAAFPAQITLYEPPSHGQVVIVGWQCPDAMEMIWQKYKGVDDKRMTFDYVAESLSQERYVL